MRFYSIPRNSVPRRLQAISSLLAPLKLSRASPAHRRVGKLRQYPFARLLSCSSVAMAAPKIDGTAIARDIRETIKTNIKKTQEINPRYKPSLIIVQVGDRSDSSTYVRMKLKAAEEADIICNIVNFPESITEPELLQNITKFNNDPTIHGILVQLPVPRHISEHAVTSAVAEEKDVDGFGACNIGELAKRGGQP